MSAAFGVDPNALADRILSLRRARGLSQDEVANAVGVSRQSVSKWESAQSLPDLDRAITLAAFFGVSMDELLLGVRPQTAAPVPVQPPEPPVRRTQEPPPQQIPEAPPEPSPEADAPQPTEGRPGIRFFQIASFVLCLLGFLLFALVEVEFPVSPNNVDSHAPYEYCNLLALGVGLFFTVAGFAVFAVGQALNAPKLVPWKTFLHWTGPFLAVYPVYIAFYIIERHALLGLYAYVVCIVLYCILLSWWLREFQKSRSH